MKQPPESGLFSSHVEPYTTSTFILGAIDLFLQKSQSALAAGVLEEVAQSSGGQ